MDVKKDLFSKCVYCYECYDVGSHNNKNNVQCIPVCIHIFRTSLVLDLEVYIIYYIID